MYLTGGTVETGISAALTDLDSSRASDSNAASQGGYLLPTCNITHVYITRGTTGALIIVHVWEISPLPSLAHNYY